MLKTLVLLHVLLLLLHFGELWHLLTPAGEGDSHMDGGLAKVGVGSEAIFLTCPLPNTAQTLSDSSVSQL